MEAECNYLAWKVARTPRLTPSLSKECQGSAGGRLPSHLLCLHLRCCGQLAPARARQEEKGRYVLFFFIKLHKSSFLVDLRDANSFLGFAREILRGLEHVASSLSVGRPWWRQSLGHRAQQGPPAPAEVSHGSTYFTRVSTD